MRRAPVLAALAVGTALLSGCSVSDVLAPSQAAAAVAMDRSEAAHTFVSINSHQTEEMGAFDTMVAYDVPPGGGKLSKAEEAERLLRYREATVRVHNALLETADLLGLQHWSDAEGPAVKSYANALMAEAVQWGDLSTLPTVEEMKNKAPDGVAAGQAYSAAAKALGLPG